MKQDFDDRPRYQRISDVLRHEITSGRVGLGEFLPPENALCDRFAVSRHTIREALRALKEEGLIKSRQGSGSRVSASQRPVYTYSVNSVAELLQYATEAQYTTHKSTIVIADDGLCQKIDCKAGARWLRLEGFRLVKDDPVPVCWTEVYILSEYSGVGVLIGRQAGTIYSFIEQMYEVRIVTVEQSLFVTEMPAPAAETLQVQAASTAIVLRRMYRLRDGICPLVVVNYHVPERLRLNWTLHRSS